MLKPLEGEDKSQLEIILDGYYNLLQRKIIAGTTDKVGLILYNVVHHLLRRKTLITVSIRNTSSKCTQSKTKSTPKESKRPQNYTKSSISDLEDSQKKECL